MAETSRDPIGPRRSIRQRFPELIREFQTIAEALLRKRSAPSLNPDDLVSEAYLKLVQEELRRWLRDRSDLAAKPDGELKACFGAACRDVMSVRYKQRQRRCETRLEDEISDMSSWDWFHVEELLKKMEEYQPLMAQIAEARVYGGLTINECAEVFGVSPKSVDRIWAAARAYLRRKLEDRDSRPDGGSEPPPP